MNPDSENPTSLLPRDNLAWSMCGVDPIRKSYIASEDHLQSLGLTVDNGKPRFKLNEPCSNLATSSICLPSTVEDLNSQSFVVLSHPSLEAVQAQSLANYVQIQEKTASIDCNSVISNMSPTEIEHKLSEMLHENLKLKETLSENNEAMKKQFNSLAAWQEEVASVHQNHKQKFAETRELINQLKKENVELKMQISVEQVGIDASVFEKTTENHSLQTSITKFCNCLSREEELVKMLDDMTKELNDYKEKYEKVTKELIQIEEHSQKESKRLNQFKEKCEQLAEELTKSSNDCEKATKEIHESRECSAKELKNLKESRENYEKEKKELEAKCEKLSEELEKYVSLYNLMRLQLKQNSESSKKFDSMTGMDQPSNSNDFIVLCPVPSKTEQVQGLLKECTEKEKEISFLRELVTSLEQQVQTISKNVFSPIQSPECVEPNESLTSRSQVRQQLIQSVKSYSEKMEILVDCFPVQSSRYVRIQECLKECADILHNFENSSNEASKVDDSTLITYRNILSECRKKLVDEQLENIADRQKWIKVQDQFQKIFSDYKSALYELEIMQEENKKLTTIHDKNSEERLQQAKDLEKQLAQEKKTLEEEAMSLTLEKLSLSEERKTLDELRELFLASQESFTTELEKLEQERSSLVEEKTALDRQSKLYEAQEKALVIEKKGLMKRCEEFNERIIDMEQQLKKQSELAASDKEDLMVLRAQLDIYRSDYEQEKEAKKEVIREKNKLVEQIQGLTVQNQELRKDVDRLRQQAQCLQPRPTSSEPQQQTQGPENANTSTSGMIQLYSCPVCGQKFSSFDPLVEHVDECMRLIDQD